MNLLSPLPSLRRLDVTFRSWIDWTENDVVLETFLSSEVEEWAVVAHDVSEDQML